MVALDESAATVFDGHLDRRQREEHISQTLATFFSVPPVTALAFKFRFSVASVPIAAVLFKKFRLFIKPPYL